MDLRDDNNSRPTSHQGLRSLAALSNETSVNHSVGFWRCGSHESMGQTDFPEPAEVTGAFGQLDAKAWHKAWDRRIFRSKARRPPHSGGSNDDLDLRAGLGG
jgi:hypothetical protein